MALYWAFAYLELYAGPGGGGVRARSADRRRDPPLLMVLLQKIRRQDAGSAVADMFAVDYIGALVGGLCFHVPAAAVVRAASRERHRRTRQCRRGLFSGVRGVPAVVATARRDHAGSRCCRGDRGARGGTGAVRRFEVTARQALFRDPIVAAERTRTRTSSSPNVRPRPDPTRGCSSTATCSSPRSTSTAITRRWCIGADHPGDSVLILGGGDGLALRVLAYPDVAPPRSSNSTPG